MRILKFVAALTLPLLIALAMVAPHMRNAAVWAQLPPPNPNLGPVVPLSAPPQLAQPAATTGIPPLAIIPSPPAATPSPAVRAFNCSCFGHGSGTHWMGTVAAPGYFAARQSATGACLSYNAGKSPASPFNEPDAYAGLAKASPFLPGTEPPDAAAAHVLPGTLNTSTASQLQMCSQCTCN
ncbi:MAG TPA: hypothetical protein VJN94_16445 [Candidatus Binataceae bacterium]|nr:hypothetical protein [Candidatus Binataceae bacterium]